MINKDALKKSYDRLKELYTDKKLMRNSKFRMNHNPIKQAFEIAGTKDCVLKSTNVMYASLPSGNIAKVISIDDVTGISNEVVVYTDRLMRTTTKENIGLTTLRCGIMAVLAAELNLPITRLTRVGFIGNGKINQKTMEVLYELFGIDCCIIRGSKRNRSRNIEQFENVCHGEVLVDDTENCRLLNKCDIVFCCTSSYKKEDMISKDMLSNTKLLVIQDGGYILDESFRKGFERINFTDHEEQLHAHYKDEFPHDKKKRYFSTMRLDESKCKKAVYLYGVAIADLIVFEEFFLEDKKC